MGPIAEGNSRRTARPLVTFALFAYNQERFIGEAINGAFAQDYSPLQIILSDDSSRDGTFSIMTKMAREYEGPHEVVLNRNDSNVGIGRHYNRVMELASGEIVELAAGDDVSLPWRTSDSVSVLNADPELTCVSLGLHKFTSEPNAATVSHVEVAVTKKWRLRDFFDTPGFFVNAPARAFRKYTHDLHGPLLEECPVEDGSNLFRCLLHGAVATCDAVGVLYRWNGLNVSSPENLAKIKISAIQTDILHTIQHAAAIGHIDEATRRELTLRFERRRQKSLLIEQLRAGASGIAILRQILLCPQLAHKERLRWFGKVLRHTFR